jgi:hypothetical protein
MTTRKLMAIAFPFFVGRRLQPISYEPLRRDGFQDVEWLGKQYAAPSRRCRKGRSCDHRGESSQGQALLASPGPFFFNKAGTSVDQIERFYPLVTCQQPE